MQWPRLCAIIKLHDAKPYVCIWKLGDIGAHGGRRGPVAGGLVGELRVVRTERDLLKEQLNKFKRQLFAASSEVRGHHRRDMFFNEAESLGAQAELAAEEADDDKIDVPGHKRAKRGRKLLDPGLPRDVVRSEPPEHERVCPHGGGSLREFGVEVSEQLDIVPQQVSAATR